MPYVPIRRGAGALYDYNLNEMLKELFAEVPVTYTQITETPYSIVEADLNTGHSIYGVQTGENATITLPAATTDPAKIVVVKNEMTDFTVNILPG